LQDLISVEVAAHLIDMNAQRVRVFIREGRLPATRIGRRPYAIARAEAEQFARTARPAGRPTKNVSR
jgi:hypothetical protein